MVFCCVFVLLFVCVLFNVVVWLMCGLLCVVCAFFFFFFFVFFRVCCSCVFGVCECLCVLCIYM